MIEKTKRAIESREIALKLYDSWIRERQRRPDIACTEDKEQLESVRQKNFVTQLAEPRQRHLQQLAEVAQEMSTADKIALLVMMELPVLETSSLLHRLSVQVAADPLATYFSEVNQRDNCGSGCG